jgi:thiamine pyrophosphokinase
MEIERRPDDFVIAVDGGLSRLLRQGIEPDFLLGDFDSLDPSDGNIVERFRKMGESRFLQLPVVKDDTDTMAATRLGIQRGYREFLIYGGLGARLDHTMANIQTLVWILRQGGQGWLLDRETSVTVIGEGQFVIPEAFRGTVSLFALGDELQGVSIRGMKYDVENAVVRNDYPIGCSNETLPGARGEIVIGAGTALVVMTEKLINLHH